MFEYFVAASPFLAYLVVFKHYQFLRDATGMEQLTPPNKEVLPWLEQVGCWGKGTFGSPKGVQRGTGGVDGRLV